MRRFARRRVDSGTRPVAGLERPSSFNNQSSIILNQSPGHCIVEYDGNNRLVRKYVYGPGVDQPVCMIDVPDSNAAYYYHFDGLGSVIALSDADGNTAVVYEYDVYGRAAAVETIHSHHNNQSSIIDNQSQGPFLFTARRFDTETGLYYYRARYYNPYIGRFLQTDPIGAGANPYMYCSNNPASRLDPLGTDDCSCPDPVPWDPWDPDEQWRHDYDRCCPYCGGRLGAHYGGYLLCPAPFRSPPWFWEPKFDQGWEYYEWTGQAKITNWRREAWQDELAVDLAVAGGRIIGAAKWFNLGVIAINVATGNYPTVAARFLTSNTPLTASVFMVGIEEAIKGLREVPDIYLEAADGYRAWVKVRVYKRHYGLIFGRHGRYKYVGKRWIEIQCGEGWGETAGVFFGNPWYETRQQAIDAIYWTIALGLPYRPDEHGISNPRF
jgi:RHS repeat-associated protein